MSKKVATKFLKKDSQVQQEWIQLLLADENAPLDVAHKATCTEIRKEYYPFAEFTMECVASWAATSVWEHEEEYQIAETETVYISFDGKEYSTPGTDREYRGSRTITHHRTPQQRTKYTTKTRTVTDKVEPTQGDVGPLELIEKIPLSKFPNVDQELRSFEAHSIQNSRFIEVDEDFLSDYLVVPASVSDNEALSQASDNALSEMTQYAKKKVPGNRFENFELTFFDIQQTHLTDAYIGFYHVFYTYEDEQYECFISGCNDGTGCLLEKRPVDESIKAKNDLIEEGSTTHYIRKFFFIIAGAMITLGCTFDLISSGFDEFSLKFDLPFIVIGLYLIARFAIVQTLHHKLNKDKEAFDNFNTTVKTQIAEISSSKGISDEEKQQVIAELASTKPDTMSPEEISSLMTKEKKQNRMANIVGIVALALAIVLPLVFDAINDPLAQTSQTQNATASSTSTQRIANEEQDNNANTSMNNNSSASSQEANNEQQYSYSSASNSANAFYVLPESDSAYYSTADLSGLSDQELYVARNEIYARHGRTFKNADLQNWFNQMSWYQGIYSPEEFDSKVQLNDYEKQNANTILALEKSRGSVYAR